MSLAALKFLTPTSEAGARAERRSPDLTLIEGSAGDKTPAVRDTLGAHLVNAALATYTLIFVANAIATHAA